MNTILTILLIIVAISGIIWTILKLVKAYYNIKTLWQASRHPSTAKQRLGIIYNKKEETLEADQSFTTPF
jgi:hypothetical protein